MQEQTVPLIAPGGRVIDHLDRNYLLSNAGHFEIKFSRRGHPRSAMRKERKALTPLSNKGSGFEQTLDSGLVIYALRGILGSEKTAAVSYA